MICSISTGKSGSNWLDRLRSSKGFPPGNHPDLDQFLNHPPHPSCPNSSPIELAHSSSNDINPNSNRSQPQPTQISNQIGERELSSVVTNVIAELFIMGGTSHLPTINSKKSTRKQASPKICLVTASTIADSTCNDDARMHEEGSPMLPSSGDSSRVDVKETSDHTKPSDLKRRRGASPLDAEDEERSHTDLSSFSRTEVTVIDTSCPSWKFDKLLFRRKNVWKVRDKKCKSPSIGKKKRKASCLDESAVGHKKSKPKFTQCDTSKKGLGEDGAMPSSGGYHNQETVKEACKETPDVFGQVPKRRFPRKFKKEGSSVVLIKNIPTSKKNGANVSKSCLNSSRRQLKGC